MKKLFKKSTALLIALVLIMTTLLISPISATAAESPLTLENSGLSVWADPENVLTQSDVTDFNANSNKLALLGGIQPYKRSTSSSKYYLFLPSNADCSALKFWFDGTLTIDSTAVTSGVPTNIFAGINEGGVSSTVNFVLNSTSYSVTVIKSGQVGTVYIDTQSGSLSTITVADKSGYEGGSIMVVQPNGTVDYVGVMEKMSGRGNGTWSATNTKNPYNVKLAKSASLLDMPSAKKWCLLANVNDNTLVKNQLTYDFAKYVGVKYQPICRPVDLYVNQQYLGSYQLAEKVELKSNRINVSDAYENLEMANGTTDAATGIVVPADLTGTTVNTVNKTMGGIGSRYDYTGHTVGAKKVSSSLKEPTDYTGGYLYELEISQRWYEENAGFCAYNRQGWVIKSCDYASTNMIDYSYDLLYALGASVYNGGTVPSSSTTTTCSLLTLTTVHGSNSVTNPAPATQYQGKSWSDLLDSDSAVRYYWTQEFFKNMDSSTSSTYFYKDSDSMNSKLYAGPVWDMDNSIGFDLSDSRWGYSWTSSDGWYTKNTRIYRWRTSDSTMTYSSDNHSPLSFYGALATNCSDFWTDAERYWYKYISPAVDIISGNAQDKSGVLKSAEYYVTTVAKSALMNAIRHNLNNDTYDSATYISSMNNWFTARQTWIDSQITKTDVSSATLGAIADQYYTGEEITPKLTVSIFKQGVGTVKLEEGIDYNLTYSNNINAGTATATVNGFGTYTGTANRTFNIVATPLSNTTLTIDSAAYSNMNITAVLTSNSTGKEFTDSHTYQWYRDGVAIDGATDKIYTVTADDVGTSLTVKATGDGKNLSGTVTSNACTVLSGTRPTGYTRTIASWDYDYTADNTLLTATDPTGTSYEYLATGGENQSTSLLYGSVNATDRAKIKWSGTADLFTDGDISDQAPIMGTSKTDGLAWGEYPYFEAAVSTAGYEGIKFSAKLGGTKKGPKSWKLQYSLDGASYTDIDGAVYSIVKNKAMETAFENVVLPSECENQKTVYIRIVASANVAINGINTIVGQLNGDATVNNVKVTGSSMSVVTSLVEPTVTPDTNSSIFADELVNVTDNNGGADVFYSINGGEPVLYTTPFSPFNPKTSVIGDSATITAYAKFNDIVSPTTTAVYTFAGVNINSFSYSDYSTDVTAGSVASSGGVYGESGLMTAYTDGTSQYVPLWNAGNGSFSVSPDDGAVWTENSGFTYKISTAGYKNINFSCKAYTTLQGPKSITLQYSLNGTDYINVQSNVALSANAMLEQLFKGVALPAECSNQRVLYIRLATTENLTASDTTLHNSASKGNLYVNDVIVGGEDDGTYKMPYTNKSTNYFGTTGTITYYSADNMAMKYAVYDSNSNLVKNGTYPALTGIQLSTVTGFDPTKQEPYTVLVWVEEDEDSSLVNARTYYYKGDTVVKFNFNSTTKLFNNYVSSDFLTVSNSSGVNSGTLAMYPNGTDKTSLSYTDTYGVKTSWTASNPYTATKTLDKPDGNGFWLIETSSLGFNNLTLNLEQLSSNNGPRDWGIAYSTNGSSYKYVSNSNARAISNDSASSTVETYGNLVLPAECNNQEKLYIKVFINGGESVDGTELELVTKGNTGINTVELSGTPIGANVTFKTTVLESKTATTGTASWSGAEIYADGIYRGVTDDNGSLTLSLAKNTAHTVVIKGAGITERTVTVPTVTDGSEINVPLLVFDANNDGYINAKDYAIINKNSKYSPTKQYFVNFINTKTSEFIYQ